MSENGGDDEENIHVELNETDDAEKRPAVITLDGNVNRIVHTADSQPPSDTQS